MIRALGHLALIATFQWLGTWLVTIWSWPLPGVILGMLLFLVFLFVVGDRVSEGLRQTGKTLIQLLPLWFIPAGAGILAYRQPLTDYGAELIVILLLSTLITFVCALGVSGWRSGDSRDTP